MGRARACAHPRRRRSARSRGNSARRWRLAPYSQVKKVEAGWSLSTLQRATRTFIYICKCETDGTGDDCRVVILRGREWVEGGDGGEARRGGPAEIPVQSSFMNPQASALSTDLSAQNRSVKRSKRSPRRALRPSASPPHSWPWRAEIIRPNRGALTSLTDYRQT